MIKIKDLYFIAWLNIKKNIQYTITKQKIFKNRYQNDIYLHMTRNEYKSYKKEYENTDKKFFKYVKNLVKKINNL